MKTTREVMEDIAKKSSKTKEKKIPEKTKSTVKPKVKCGKSVYVHHEFDDPNFMKKKLRCGNSVYVRHNFEDPNGKFRFKN